jgi:diguanylate cyclase (GGDEF)-like protein/PAS domain S-box-containing protein
MLNGSGHSATMLGSGTWGLQLVELVSNFIGVIDEGRFVFVNSAGARMLGAASPGRLIGRRALEIVHPSSRDDVTIRLNSSAGETGRFPARLIGFDGGLIDVELAIRRYGDGPSHLIEARDVTETKRVAESVRSHERKLEGILDAVLEGIISVSPDGNIRSFNRAAERIFGYTAAETLEKPLSMLLPEPHATQHDGYIKRYMETGRTWVMNVSRELSGRRKDGTVFPLEINVTQTKQGEERVFIGVIRDVSERKRAQERLKLAATVFDTASEAILLTDSEFCVTASNPAFSLISGYGAEETLGGKPPFMSSPDLDEKFYLTLWQALQTTGRWEGEFWNRRKSGERFAEQLSITAVRDETGNISQYVMVSSDVTQRRRAEERIRHQATHDSLTELPNRVLFLDTLGEEIDRHADQGGKGALLFLDLDGFRLVNETLGHDIGDLLLREAGRRLIHTVRGNDFAARLRGDEFVVLMRQIDSPEDAARLAQAVIDAMNQPFDLEGYEAIVSCCVGVAMFPERGEAPNTVLKNATAAKTRARDTSRSGFAFFSPEISDAFKERLAIKNNLSKALERGEFLLNYQPKLDLATGAIVGAEALLRWRNPWLGNVAPVKFIPVLEETGLIVEVGEWVLETACRQQKIWASQGFPELSVAVNLSARQLRPGIVGVVERILERTGISPSGLEIEITESLIMSDADQAVILLRDLAAMGIRLSMDDFGTGYSSLSYLKRFPLDTIKIDRSFVRDLASSRDDAEIVRTIVTMGHSLRRKVVAEGVETLEQLTLLNDFECDEIQGYLLSPPATADVLTEMMRAPPGLSLLAEAGAGR